MTEPRPPQLDLLTRYLLDANVFIAAWRDHYPIDLHPGFWECLQRFRQEGRLHSVDRVREEINSPNELVVWLRRNWRGAFSSTRTSAIARVFSEMQRWVRSNDQLLPVARHEFAQAADGWLAAYAKTHNSIVVTNEKTDEGAKRRVPLPNLCKQFDVGCCNTIGMLRELGVAFDLRLPS